MNSVQEIKAPIREELSKFESHFRESMKSDVPLLNKITHYIVKRKGKQMRPMFVFLSGKVFGEVREGTYTAASLIELLHTATLVHDDVVDDANERRGYFSLNALWKNKIAVLVGDYLLSRGLLTSVENDQQELLRIVSRAVERMSEGELLQMEKARLLNLTEETYYRVIGHKTASLISACCEAGAYSTEASEEERERMRAFGEAVGMAFQIKDDLFDYGDGMDTGKATGIDIQERKLTLPLIHTMANSDKRTKKRLGKIIKERNKDRKQVEEVIDTVRSNGGLDYAREQMEGFKRKALEELYTMPDNEARRALEGLVIYTTERSK
jgi:octaprenyl-diphosphate synthase